MGGARDLRGTPSRVEPGEGWRDSCRCPSRAPLRCGPWTGAILPADPSPPRPIPKLPLAASRAHPTPWFSGPRPAQPIRVSWRQLPGSQPHPAPSLGLCTLHVTGEAFGGRPLVPASVSWAGRWGLRAQGRCSWPRCDLTFAGARRLSCRNLLWSDEISSLHGIGWVKSAHFPLPMTPWVPAPPNSRTNQRLLQSRRLTGSWQAASGLGVHWSFC